MLDPVDIRKGRGNQVTRHGLQHIRELNEGTQAYVLSAQKSDITLVRDLLKEYGARDYIAKWEVDEKGNAFLVQNLVGGSRCRTICSFGQHPALQSLDVV